MRKNKTEKNVIDQILKLSLEREKCIKEASNKPIRKDYGSNRVSSELHPDSLVMQIKEIKVESPTTKSFVLVTESDFPNFLPGQYVTIDVLVDGLIYNRAFTISSSPSRILQNEIEITVKRTEHGLISNYFFYQVNVGDYFTVHGPFGNFTYQSLRDEKHVLALASGSGIIPFRAMAHAICDGICEIDLTILYEVTHENEILFHEELDELCKKNNHIHVVYVLREEVKEGYQKNNISKELILRYQKEHMSYFVCGSKDFYSSMNVILKELKIANKYIRHDFYNECEIPTNEETYELRILTGGKEKIVFGRGNETILQTLEREGIAHKKRCGVGVCGFCRSKLLSGSVLTNDKYLRAADKKYHYIHPCASYPISNLKIRLPK